MTLQKMPQLWCVKLEDPKNFTSQALRRSRAVIHLDFPNAKNTSSADGMLAVVRTVTAFSFRKSTQNLMVPSFLGTGRTGDIQGE